MPAGRSVDVTDANRSLPVSDLKHPVYDYKGNTNPIVHFTFTHSSGVNEDIFRPLDFLRSVNAKVGDHFDVLYHSEDSQHPNGVIIMYSFERVWLRPLCVAGLGIVAILIGATSIRSKFNRHETKA